MNTQLSLITMSPVQTIQEEALATSTLPTDSIVTQVALINVPTSNVVSASKPQKKIKCEFEGCNRKISIIEAVFIACLCEKKFCPSHRFFSDHDCTVDYKTRDRERLAQELLGYNPTKKSGEDHRPEGNDTY